MIRVQPNQKEGMLTFISYAGKIDDFGEPMWLCQCDCGEYVEAPLQKILHKIIKDCGCVYTKLIKAREKDIRNQPFGKLTAISPNGKRNSWNEIMWLCECECGVFRDFPIGALTSGGTGSCGCYIKELNTSEADGMLHQDGTNMGILLARNPRRISNSGVVGVRYVKKSDKWLASMVFQKKTVLYKECPTFAEAVDARKKAEEKYHKPAIEKYIAYHANKLSNTPEKPKPKKRGADSGVVGVTYNKRLGKWRARLIIKQKPVLDKVCDSKEEAIEARKKAEKEYLVSSA